MTATLQVPGGSVCEADLTGDGNLDFFDVSAFLNAFNTQDSIADFDGNGAWDFFDVSAFLNAFNAGCP
jgi:PKD repeat protein